MLQAIRDRVTGIVAIFVLGLLAVPFLFFGLESYMRAVPQESVAIVGDDEITTSDFHTSFAEHRRAMREQMGDAYDDIAINQPLARREHLERMIDELLLVQYAQDLGLQVSDRAFAEFLRSVPQFQIEGQFNPEIYRQVLRTTGRTPGAFERQVKDDMLLRLVPNALSQSVLVTETEVDRLISLQRQTRQVSRIDVPASVYEDQIEVSDADIEAYYESNLSAYTEEEQVVIEYIELRGEDLVIEDTLGETELRRRYEAARQRYLTPEARRASHILIEISDQRDDSAAEQLADDLLRRIRDGESFEALAEEYSDDPVSRGDGGLLGWIEPEDLVEPVEDALYALESQGDLSEPVRSRFGWHVIRLEDIRPPEGMSFEEARAEILEEHFEREREGLYIELSERMVDLIFADDSQLAPIAEDLGLDVQQAGPFTRAGGEGIAARSSVVAAAFSDLVLIDGAVSDPLELDRNHLIAIKVVEHIRPEPRPLVEVADGIRQQLIRERARDMARDRANELLDEIDGDPSAMDDLAEQHGLELQTLPVVSRNDFQLGPDFLRELFRLPAPGEQPGLHILPAMDGFSLVRLEAVTAGNPAVASEAERRLMRQQIRFAQMSHEIEGLIEWLRENTRIRVVEERLQ